MADLWDPTIVYDSASSTYWESQLRDPATVMVPVDASLLSGSIMETRFSRTVATGLREDLAMFSLHLTVEAGPGLPATGLDSADATRVENAFTSDWWVNVQPTIANDWTLKEYAWRQFGADFPLDGNGDSKPGPYWRITPIGAAGGDSAARLPDQVALTTTLRTASRRHWGRFYAGGFTTSSLLDAKMGHATTATVDLLSTSFRTFANNIYDDTRKTWVGVWSRKYRGLCSINEISVDDTFDVVRRRRAKFPSYRKTYTS